jgi:pentatricopeptide repeat domain-containing protein 1
MVVRGTVAADAEVGMTDEATTISACEKGGQWERALGLFQAMKGEGVQPNVITYSATISACEKAGQWERALGLFQAMKGEGVQPNVIT